MMGGSGLFREYARGAGASGATFEQLDELQGLVGAELPADLVDYLFAVGDWTIGGANPAVEWGYQAGFHNLVSVSEMLEFHQPEAGDSWLDSVPLPWVMIGYADTGGGLMCVRVGDPESSGVFRLTEHGVRPPPSTSLYALSFDAFEADLLLPPELVELGVQGFGPHHRERWMSVLLPEPLDAVRGLRFTDDLIDMLVQDRPPPRSSSLTCARRGLKDSDSSQFGPVPTTEKERSTNVNPYMLMSRYAGVVAVMGMAMALDQVGGSVVDRLGLFSEDRTKAYDADQFVAQLERIAGPGDLDALAIRFRHEFAVPAARRLTAESSR